MAPRTRGFSYIELLISTALIGIAYVILLGPGSAIGQSRSKARCAEQLRQLDQSLNLYASEHEGAFPVVSGATTAEAPLSELVPLYTTDTNIFICPGSKDSALPGAEPFASRRISYAYYMGLKLDGDPGRPLVSDAQVSTTPKQAGTEIFSRSGSAPGNKHRSYGGNVLFVDGHVETFSAEAPRVIDVPAGSVLLNPQP